MTKRSNKPYIVAAAGVVLVSLSGLASAQSSGASASAVGRANLSGALSDAAATQLITTTTLRHMQNISNALSARAMARTGPPAKVADSGQQPYGIAAGGAAGTNVWGNVSGDSNKYNNGINRFSAKSTNAVFGADYALSPALALGLSAAFDRVNGNFGADYTSTGYSLAPYLGWQINKDWALDAAIGWGSSDLDTAGVTTKADRFFYGTNLTYATWYNNLQVTGKASYLYGEEKYGTSTLIAQSIKNKIDQWRLGAQAGYWMGGGAMPYFGVAYSADSGRTGLAGGNDLGKNAWIWSLGINFFSLKNSLTGGIVYNSESGRSNSKSDNVMVNINYRY